MHSLLSENITDKKREIKIQSHTGIRQVIAMTEMQIWSILGFLCIFTIIVLGVFYTLVTSNRFSGPKNASSKLNEAKKQIIKVGADYKAPEGFLSFTFKSVYEKKIMR